MATADLRRPGDLFRGEAGTRQIFVRQFEIVLGNQLQSHDHWAVRQLGRQIDEQVSDLNNAVEGLAPQEQQRMTVTVHLAAAAEAEGRTQSASKPRVADPATANAIDHLEKALAGPAGEVDPVVRATLARLYMRAAAYAKAIANTVLAVAASK